MTEHVSQTIQMVQQQVQDIERQLVDKKKMVNSLCSLVGKPPLYPDSSLQTSGGLRPLRPDEYYEKGLASAMRMVLDRREAANVGPASVSEIYEALVEGGYKFDTKNEANAKRNLYSALAKNSVTFHRLPNGSWGLMTWYPNVRASKKGKPAAEAAEDGDAAVVDQLDDQDEQFNTEDQAEQAAESVAVGAGEQEAAPRKKLPK